MSTLLTVCRWITLIAWVSLGFLILVWNTFLLDRHHHTIMGSLIIALVPLLLPLKGMGRGKIRAFIAVAMLSLLYFMHGVTEVFEPGENLPAVLEVACSLIAFVGAVGYAHIAKSLPVDG